MKKINKEYNKDLKHHSFYKSQCIDKWWIYHDKDGVIQSGVDSVRPVDAAGGGNNYTFG